MFSGSTAAAIGAAFVTAAATAWIAFVNLLQCSLLMFFSFPFFFDLGGRFVFAFFLLCVYCYDDCDLGWHCFHFCCAMVTNDVCMCMCMYVCDVKILNLIGVILRIVTAIFGKCSPV